MQSETKKIISFFDTYAEYNVWINFISVQTQGTRKKCSVTVQRTDKNNNNLVHNHSRECFIGPESKHKETNLKFLLPPNLLVVELTEWKKKQHEF